MRLIFSTLLFLVTFSRMLNGQVAYQDALKLNNHAQLGVNGKIEISPQTYEVLRIMGNYFTEAKDADGMDLSNNPFIEWGSGSQNVGFTAASRLASGIGGVDITNVSKAISQFMIQRAKDELTAAFFDRLKVYFEEHKEIEILFPETSTTLTSLLAYHYTEMLPVLRVSFLEDLKDIHTRVVDVLELPKYQKLLAKFPEVRVSVKTIRLVNSLENNVHPADIIQKFSEFSEWDESETSDDFKNFGSSWKMAAVLSHSLRYIPEPEVKSESAKKDTIVTIYKGQIEVGGKPFVLYAKNPQLGYYQKTITAGGIKKIIYIFDNVTFPFSIKESGNWIQISERDDWKSIDKESITNAAFVKITLNPIIIKDTKTIEKETTLTPSNGLLVTKTKTTFSDKTIAHFYPEISSELTQRQENESVRAWVSVEELKALIKDPMAFKIYMGLIYQTTANKSVKFTIDGKEKLATDFITATDDVLQRYQTYLSNFTELTDRYQMTKNEIEEIRETGLSQEHQDKQFLDYLDNALSIMEKSADVVKLINKEGIDIERYLSIGRNITGLLKNTRKENYSSAIVNAIYVYEGMAFTSDERVLASTKSIINSKLSGHLNSLVSSKSELEGIQGTIRALNKIIKKNATMKIVSEESENAIKLISSAVNTGSIPASVNYVDITNSLNQLFELSSASVELEEFDATLKFIRKYGLFIANMVEAETPEEVQRVIEATVLPVGSSSIKKRSDFNISVQSHLGAAFRLGDKSDVKKAWDGKVSITAPIGVSFNRGLGKAGSLGLFVSLLDLGAIVDYELAQDTVMSTSVNTATMDTTVVATVNSSEDFKIELAQIVSPGIFVTYSFPGQIPLAASLGTQYGPGLLKIENNNTLLGKPYWRWSFTLTVDIPWFTLYNKEKNKYRKAGRRK